MEQEPHILWHSKFKPDVNGDYGSASARCSFLHPHSDIRHALTVASTEQAVLINRKSNDYRPIGKILDERSFVNAIIGLHATGGSTNHTLHLPAMAAAAGIKLTWEDFSDLSNIIPLLTRIYPNGMLMLTNFMLLED